MPRWIAHFRTAHSVVVLVAVLVVLLPGPEGALAQRPVDSLIAQIFGAKDTPGSELTAYFHGEFSIASGGASTGGTASGLYREWRPSGGGKRWQITVQDLELPWILRPFSGAIRTTIEKRAEAQAEAFENFRDHDVFIVEEQAGGRYVLVGLRKDLVDEAVARYGKPSDKYDEATRRAIAKWLFTSPTMQSWIIRPGAPYAVKVLVDEAGLIHDMQVLYDWGQVGMKFSYIRVGDRPVWQEVVSTFSKTNVSGLGHIEGLVKIAFTDFKVEGSPQTPETVVDEQHVGNRRASPGP